MSNSKSEPYAMKGFYPFFISINFEICLDDRSILIFQFLAFFYSVNLLFGLWENESKAKIDILKRIKWRKNGGGAQKNRHYAINYFINEVKIRNDKANDVCKFDSFVIFHLLQPIDKYWFESNRKNEINEFCIADIKYICKWAIEENRLFFLS